MRFCTVALGPGLAEQAASVWRARAGVAATPPAPIDTRAAPVPSGAG
jgi:hypothetical protein